MRTFEMPATDRIVEGSGSRRELAAVLKSLGASRALLVTGRSLGGNPAFEEISRTLAGAGIATAAHVGAVAHNPVERVMDLVGQAREFRPDAIVALGGGTPVDAAKLTSLALAADAADREAFLSHAVQFRYPDTEFVKEVERAPVPVVALPTTLSAAEWDGFASCVDMQEKRKIVFRDRRMTPRVVILDPELAAMTPRDLWITSGVRAIDHAVESACSMKAHPYATSLALGALDLLSRNLVSSFEGPGREDSILACQLAAGMSIAGIHTVSLGLSHALGHQLGAFGIPHGVTSCLTLPHVMRFLEPVTRDAQEAIARTLGRDAGGNKSAADLLDGLFSDLNVPRRIRDYGIGLDDLAAIADRALGDVVVRECPVPLTQEKLRNLLEKAW